VDAIANFIQITQINGSAANNASLDRSASAPARTDWLIARSIASHVLCNILGGIPENSWRPIQHAVTCAIGRSNLGTLERGCVCDTILAQVVVLIGVLSVGSDGPVPSAHGAIAAGLLALGDFAGLVHVDASYHPHQKNRPCEGYVAAHCESLLPVK
jgi:hypothetical protein